MNMPAALSPVDAAPDRARVAFGGAARHIGSR